jgi:hypothetical protein
VTSEGNSAGADAARCFVNLSNDMASSAQITTRHTKPLILMMTFAHARPSLFVHCCLLLYARLV